MNKERSSRPSEGVFAIAGQGRSPTAIERGYTWQDCQKNDKPVLCAIQLWDALENVGLDPNRQVFFNLWDDKGNPDKKARRQLKKMMKNGFTVIGLGKIVQKELRELNIPHLEIPHPAARGKLRRREVYRKRVKEGLARG